MCGERSSRCTVYWKWENCAVGQRDVRHNWWLVCLLMDSGRDWNEKTSHSLSLNQKYSLVVHGARSSGSKRFLFPRLFIFFDSHSSVCASSKSLFLERRPLRCQTNLEVTFIFSSPLTVLKGLSILNCAIVKGHTFISPFKQKIAIEQKLVFSLQKQRHSLSIPWRQRPPQRVRPSTRPSGFLSTSAVPLLCCSPVITDSVEPTLLHRYYW